MKVLPKKEKTHRKIFLEKITIHDDHDKLKNESRSIKRIAQGELWHMLFPGGTPVL